MEELEGCERMRDIIDATLERDKCEACGFRPTPQLIRERANVARAASTLSAELRQRDKHELEQDFQMEAGELDALIVEYLRERPSDVRELVKQSLSEMESGDHLLSH